MGVGHEVGEIWRPFVTPFVFIVITECDVGNVDERAVQDIKNIGRIARIGTWICLSVTQKIPVYFAFKLSSKVTKDALRARMKNRFLLTWTTIRIVILIVTGTIGSVQNIKTMR